MLEINVTINAPALAEALGALAAALGIARTAAPPPAPAANPAPIPGPNPMMAYAQPPAAAPLAPISTPAASAAPPSVPVAPAPAYTHDQILAAGAALIDAGKLDELIGLLDSFGVQAVTQLAPDQLGACATGLRKLGAQI